MIQNETVIGFRVYDLVSRILDGRDGGGVGV